GAGQMGTGIAHVVALGGYSVALNDLKKETYDDSVALIEKNMARQASKGVIKESDAAAALKRIAFVSDYDGFQPCDIIIEAATEDEDIKRKIFVDLCPKL